MKGGLYRRRCRLNPVARLVGDQPLALAAVDLIRPIDLLLTIFVDAGRARRFLGVLRLGMGQRRLRFLHHGLLDGFRFRFRGLEAIISDERFPLGTVTVHGVVTSGTPPALDGVLWAAGLEKPAGSGTIARNEASDSSGPRNWSRMST
jgi:hypothetical protein